MIIFRGLAPSRRNLFAGLDCGCVLILSVSDVCDFQLLFVPTLRPFGTNRWKKNVLERDAKSVQKDVCRPREEKLRGGWGVP